MKYHGALFLLGRLFSSVRQTQFHHSSDTFLLYSRLYTFSGLAVNFKSLRCKRCLLSANICSPTVNNSSPTMNRYPSSVNRFCFEPCYCSFYQVRKPCFLSAKIRHYFRFSKLLCTYLHVWVNRISGSVVEIP